MGDFTSDERAQAEAWEEENRMRYRKVIDKFHQFLNDHKKPIGKVTKSAVEQARRDYLLIYPEWEELSEGPFYRIQLLDQQTQNAFHTVARNAYDRVKEYDNAELAVGGRRKKTHRTKRKSTRRKSRR